MLEMIFLLGNELNSINYLVRAEPSDAKEVAHFNMWLDKAGVRLFSGPRFSVKIVRN